jgi:hypothetical protein
MSMNTEKSAQSFFKSLVPFLFIGVFAAIAFGVWKLAPEPSPYQPQHNLGDQVARAFNGR